MNTIASALDTLSGWVWGWPLLILLFGTHLFLTVRTGFIQKYLWSAIRISFNRKSEGEGDVSHFGALMTALAATIGTGNIVGVAAAVAVGGPGAVLWIWMTGVFGMATKYSEALLAVKYRIASASGAMCGGPMYVLERGMKMRWLGLVFALFTSIAAFGIGNAVQANSVANLMKETLDVSPWVSGAVMTFLTALVMIGGIKWIARACEALVPVMAIGYIIGCIAVIAVNAAHLGEALRLILTSAFTGQAAVGGFLGAGMREVIRAGVSRGLFSNESGLGSAPIVAAAAQTKTPIRQALVSSTGTFWDTVVVCALTGLAVVSSGTWTQGLNGPELSRATFATLPHLGPAFLTFGLTTFVFSTILGWSYYGEKAIEYLAGSWAIRPYRWLWVVAVMVGSIVKVPAVWAFADIANGLMAIPNLISLIALSGVIAAETKKNAREAAKV